MVTKGTSGCLIDSRRLFELFSAKTLEPGMMQTITMSAKLKDKVAVIERELENVFEEETIKVCVHLLLNSNSTDNGENTEVSSALFFSTLLSC